MTRILVPQLIYKVHLYTFYPQSAPFRVLQPVRRVGFQLWTNTRTETIATFKVRPLRDLRQNKILASVRVLAYKNPITGILLSRQSLNICFINQL